MGNAPDTSLRATPDFGPQGSVQRAVEKEMRRRRLLIAVFILMALVPVAVAFSLLTAPRALAPVAQQATPSSTSPSLAPEWQEQIKLNNTKITVQENQLAQFDQKLGQLSSSQAQLAQQVKQQNETVVDVPKMIKLPPSESSSLQHELEALKVQVTALTEKVEQVQQQNLELQRQVKELGVRKLEVQPTRPQ